MKKIMKKALSLVLALVMVLSLAPMTAMAASSSMTGELSADGGVNTVLFDGEAAYVYEWTPAESGAYTFTFYESDWVCSILDPNSGYADFGAFSHSSGVFTYEFVAGTTYEISILNMTWTADDINFKVEAGAAVAGPVIGSPEAGSPADVTEAMSGLVQAGAVAYFVITGVDASKTYNVYVENAATGPATYMAQFGVAGTTPFGDLQSEMVYNVVSVSAQVAPVYGDNLFVVVENPNTLDLTVNFSYEAIDGEGGEDTEATPVLGGDSVGTAVDVTETGMLGTIPAGTTQYYCVSGLDPAVEYDIWATNTVAGPAAYMDYITLTAYYPNEEVQAGPASQVVEVYVTATPSARGMVFFAVTNDNLQDLTIKFDVVPAGGEIGGEDEEDAVLGSYGNPDTIGTGATDLAVVPGEAYWVVWTAAEAGVVTLETTLEYAYVGADSVNGGYDYVSTATDTSVSVQVAVGDAVLFCASHGEANVIPVNVTFEKGAVIEIEDDIVEEYGVEINETYFYNYSVLGLEPVWVFPESDYPVTLYTFTAEETGTYLITLSEESAFVGYYGSNEWFPYDDAAGAGVEKTNTYVLNYTEAGRPALIGISGTMATEVTIEKQGEAVENKIPEVYCSVSAETYVFTGNAADLTYVDIEDAKEDVAVLGKDGFYHLNTENGPILLVNLMDDVLSLGKATATGKVAITVDVDGDGAIDYIQNWNDALDAYVANLDTATGLYPLTEELMYIYRVYGEQQSWYKETGFVGGQLGLGNPADAWMFACMYVPNAADGTIVVPPVVVAPEQITDKVVNKDTLASIIEEAVKENRPVVVPTTDETITITFEAADLENFKALDLNIEVTTTDDVKDETVAKNDKITADNFVLKVEFAHTGDLPAMATITIEVPAEYANQTLYYYEITADGALKYVCDAPVDANGIAKVAQNHCSDYVLLTEKLVEKLPEELPTTGDSTNFVLWISILGLGVVAMAGSVGMKKKQF